jgi:hypothetical protein
LIIIERRLFSKFGHEPLQINSIKKMINYKDTFILTCKNQNIEVKKNKTYPLLLEYDRKNDGKESFDYLMDNAKAIKSFLEKNDIKNESILIPSARIAELSIIVLLLDLLPLDKYPTIHIRILNKGYLDNVIPEIKKKFINLVKDQNIFLYAETNELVRALDIQYRISSNMLLLPCLINKKTIYSPKKNLRNFTIGCLGSPRSNKGISKIPLIIKELRTILKHSQIEINIIFLVQIGNLKIRKKLFFLLKEFLSRYVSRQVKVEILYDDLNNDDFIKTIKKVDVFLLPYSLQSYQFAGSGFIIDGTMLNKPIVYTNGIAMQDFLNRGNAISADTPTEFAYALEKIILDYEIYQIQSSEVSKLFENQFKISQKILNSLIK